MGDRYIDPRDEEVQPDSNLESLARRIARRVLLVGGYPMNEDVFTQVVMDVFREEHVHVVL